ncbi:ATP-binding protein [Thermococcus chitonophagus]|uniref:ATP-binding protein n=1 Tax=Thermococcus chitonophagus TaxID=54262 RepID=UPI000AEF4641|nr:ATP-binding protein [Thermococcus chitonophagus]
MPMKNICSSMKFKNWKLFVKRAVEREGFSVFLTGSSSKLLSKETASSLRGRTLTFELFPFSFREFLKAKGLKVEKYISTKKEARIKAFLREYLEFGGFPEIVFMNDEYLKRKTLEEYVDVMLYRDDVVERHSIKNLKAVRLFLKLLITSFSKKFSINRSTNYMRSLGIEVSKNTLYNYLEYFSDAYVIFPLKRFSYSLKEVEKSLPKIYVVDNGLINVYSLRFSEDIGRLMKNVVFLELRRREKEVYYFKANGNEVDFLIKNGKDVSELIQVFLFDRGFHHQR